MWSRKTSEEQPVVSFHVTSSQSKQCPKSPGWSWLSESGRADARVECAHRCRPGRGMQRVDSSTLRSAGQGSPLINRAFSSRSTLWGSEAKLFFATGGYRVQWVGVWPHVSFLYEEWRFCCGFTVASQVQRIHWPCVWSLELDMIRKHRRAECWAKMLTPELLPLSCMSQGNWKPWPGCVAARDNSTQHARCASWGHP